MLSTNKLTKNAKAVQSKLDNSKVYTPKDAIDFLKKSSFCKFDETLDVAVRLGVNPKYSDQMVRGVVSLPCGTGKTLRVAVICKESKFEEAKNAGADLVGAEDLIADIKNNIIKFDFCIATPDMMGMVGSVARILGPKGLMPNPKLGSVTNDIAEAVTKAKAGQVEFRVDKNGIVHAGLGKLSFEVNNLAQNFDTFLNALLKLRPSTLKGTYVKKVFVSSTMGPGLEVALGDMLS